MIFTSEDYSSFMDYPTQKSHGILNPFLRFWDILGKPLLGRASTTVFLEGSQSDLAGYLWLELAKVSDVVAWPV